MSSLRTQGPIPRGGCWLPKVSDACAKPGGRGVWVPAHGRDDTEIVVSAPRISHCAGAPLPTYGECDLPSDQLVRKVPDRLAIDRGPVPFAHRFKIFGAFAIGRATLEAADMQQVRGGGQHVGDAVA